MTDLDRLTANPPDERNQIGQADGETCGRCPEPDEDQPPNYRPKPCTGVMVDAIGAWVVECDSCGEIGD